MTVRVDTDSHYAWCAGVEVREAGHINCVIHGRGQFKPCLVRCNNILSDSAENVPYPPLCGGEVFPIDQLEVQIAPCDGEYLPA